MYYLQFPVTCGTQVNKSVPKNVLTFFQKFLYLPKVDFGKNQNVWLEMTSRMASLSLILAGHLNNLLNICNVQGVSNLLRITEDEQKMSINKFDKLIHNVKS